MTKVYPTDLTDDQWAFLAPLLPAAERGGRPRTAALRLVLNAIFYLSKAGCQWAMLPTDLAERSTAHDYLSRWKADGTWQAVLDAVRRQVRVAAGREAEPSKAAIDSQTVEGSESGGPRGYDGGKKINGRKRHLVVDSMGLILVVAVTAGNLDDGTYAPNVSAELTAAHTSRLDEVRGDGKSNNRELDRYLVATGAKDEVTVVERPAGATGLVHLPYRWVVERTNAWVGKYRRNGKDDERTTAVAEAVIQVSTIHLMLKRLKPDPDATQAAFRYARTPLRKAVPVPG
jgi:putative transposase